MKKILTLFLFSAIAVAQVKTVMLTPEEQDHIKLQKRDYLRMQVVMKNIRKSHGMVDADSKNSCLPYDVDKTSMHDRLDIVHVVPVPRTDGSCEAPQRNAPKIF